MLRSSRNRPAQSRSSSRSSWRRRRCCVNVSWVGPTPDPYRLLCQAAGAESFRERSRDVERRKLGIGSSRRSWGKFRRAPRLSSITRSGEARAESRVASVVLSHEPLCRGYLPVALNKIRTALGDLEIGRAPVGNQMVSLMKKPQN